MFHKLTISQQAGENNLKLVISTIYPKFFFPVVLSVNKDNLYSCSEGDN